MKPIKFIFILFLTQVTACSYFFPDKEKDYVYSKVIKPLDMPPDLQAEESLPKLDPDLMPVTLSNTITHIGDGTATYLRINSPFAHAWRIVGKALTELSIEVTDKNRATAIYYVEYDPDAPLGEDRSSWDKIVFFFGGDANNEKPYQIFLTQTEQGTEIYVRDYYGDALNHGDGLKLLNLLYKTIEKGFGYSEEITPLDTSPDISPDLQAEESLPEPGPVMPVTSSNTITNIGDGAVVYSPDLQAEEPLPEPDPVLMPVTLSNTITRVDEGAATYLRINSPFAHAWRVVGKALTATAIEIIDKNRSLAIYYVQYDPDLQAVKDGSFWDEVVFFFGDDPNQERPYQVYLSQTEQGTEIYVRDDFGDNLNQGNGLKLLNLLYETIQKDFES